LNGRGAAAEYGQDFWRNSHLSLALGPTPNLGKGGGSVALAYIAEAVWRQQFAASTVGKMS
jgi:hypothetical protein